MEPSPAEGGVNALSLEEREAAALAELTEAAEFASEPRTLQEIGNRLGYSRERIRQLEEQALSKLRSNPSVDMESLAELISICDRRCEPVVALETREYVPKRRRGPAKPVVTGLCISCKTTQLSTQNTSGRCKPCHSRYVSDLRRRGKHVGKR